MQSARAVEDAPASGSAPRARPHRRPYLWLALIVALALALHAPCLGWGFYADDYGHRAILAGEPHPTMRPWSLYDFGASPKPGDTVFEHGSLAWWTDAEWKVRFFRPLTSCSLWLDHLVYGEHAAPQHLTGLLLFGCLLVAAHALFRAFGLAPLPALLATALLGVEDGSTVPVGWLANRNSLLDALFTVLAVLCVARPRPLRPRAVAGALALACCAALSKESGVVAFLLVALVLHRRSDASSAPRRAGAGAAAGCAALYVALLLQGGFGARCAFYPTPWGEPAAFLRGLVLLIGTAPAGLASPFPMDLLWFFPKVGEAALLPCAVLVPVLAVVSFRIARRAAAASLASVTTFLLWTFATLLPQAGAPISDRLLLTPMVGFAPLLALALAAGWKARRRAVRAGAWTLFALAGPLSAASLLARGAQMGPLARAMRNVVLDAEVGSPELGRREVLLLNAPSEVAALSPLPLWLLETGDRDVRFWQLQFGRRPVRWTRVAGDAFELRSAGEPFLNGPIERVLLDPHAGDVAHKRWHTAFFVVEPIEVTAEGLTAARFRLRASLDAPNVRFLAWDGERMARIAPPPVGESLELASPAPLFEFLP